MADADEDILLPRQPSNSPSSSQPHQQPDTDLTDEAQDFRFLNSIGQQPDPSIPKRGEKDFEPLLLRSQVQALDASRQAMHNALSYPRLHSSKAPVVGWYLPKDDWIEDNGDASGIDREMAKIGSRCVRVNNFRSVYARTMGLGDRRNQTWLWPEEALFLLERGSLDIRWPLDKHGREGNSDAQNPAERQGDTDEPGEGGGEFREYSDVPMSLQGAYACLIGRSGLTLERYVVFAGLRRSGYVVTRASTWGEDDMDLNEHVSTPAPTTVNSQIPMRTPLSLVSGMVALINRVLLRLFSPRREPSCPALGPLVGPGLYRSYNDIFRALALVPEYNPTTVGAHTTKTRPPFRISFDVFKPNTPYKKSSPPPPDFHVAVLDARSSDIPKMEEIGALLDTMPDDSLPTDRRLEQRIKHGTKNVILAVVDCGVISYVRFNEASIGSIKLYEQKTGKQGKKGGHRRKFKSR